jgi:2-polyprenyl-3-methyl-5-hydroxy-6-metoxy-1,4-benzoquinol methylase
MNLDALAVKTGLNSKYLREWLGCNAAAGYITYNEADATYSLSEEQALIFTREGQPACMQGFFQAVVGQYERQADAVATFKRGEGRPWANHSSCCFCGTNRFFRPGYEANLLTEWLPALEGVTEKLEAGAKVADIGCGYGSSTVLMAKQYPNSRFVGIDMHEPSLDAAREQAAQAGVSNVEFEQGTAQDFEEGEFDFACIFDALHDMGDPVGGARHIREQLKDDGTLMLVEPMAGDTLNDNLHPLGQIYYGFSCVVCTPASLSQPVGLGLGAQAGQKRLTEVLNEAGWSKVRRAAETPTNMVLEVTA